MRKEKSKYENKIRNYVKSHFYNKYNIKPNDDKMKIDFNDNEMKITFRKHSSVYYFIDYTINNDKKKQFPSLLW